MKLLDLNDNKQDYSADIEESDPVAKALKYSNLSIQKPLNFQVTKPKNFSPFKKFEEINSFKEAKENKFKNRPTTAENNFYPNTNQLKLL